MSQLDVNKSSKWILGVRVDDVSDDLLAMLFAGWVQDSVFHSIVTPNPEFILLAQTSEKYKSILASADLSLPDGVGVQFASTALTGEQIVYRQTGVDSIHKVLEAVQQTGGRVLLMGDDAHGLYAVGALSRAREVLAARYSNIAFDSFDPGVLQKGDFSLELARDTVERAAGESYKAIFVALPMATQLAAMEAYRETGYKGIVMGIGGTLDAIAGTAKRAPAWMRRIGFEWLWRFWREPSRYKRMYNAVIVFPCKIAYTAWEQGHLFQSIKRVFRYLLTGSYVRN